MSKNIPLDPSDQPNTVIERRVTEADRRQEKVDKRQTRIERRRRRRRSSRHRIASAFGVFLLIILVAVSAFFWRLGQGPIRLTSYLPSLEKHFATLVPGYKIDVGRADLIWASRVSRPQLQLGQVQLARTENGRVSRFGQLRADISLSALMIGDIKFNKVVLDDLELTVERSTEGELMVSLPGIESSGGRLDFRELLKSTEDGPLSLITKLELHGLKLTLRDAQSGEFWEAPTADISLRTNQNGLEISIETEPLKNGWPLRGSALLASNGELVTILSGNRINSQSLPSFAVDFIPPPFRDGELDGAVLFTLNPWGQVIAAHGDVAIVLPKPIELKIAQSQMELKELVVEAVYEPKVNRLVLEAITLAGKGVEIEGTGSVEKTGSGETEQAQFTFDGFARILPTSGLYPTVTDFEKITANGRFAPSSGRLKIEAFAISSGPVTVKSSGQMFVGGEQATTIIKGHITGLDIKNVKRLWPTGAASGAINWITGNMISGQIEDARFSLVSIPGADEEQVSLVLDYTYHDVSAYHIGRTTPITGASGRAHLTLETFDIWMDEGRLGNIALKNGKFSIPDLAGDVQNAKVAIEFSGSATDILTFLDEPPISALSSVDINPVNLKGNVAGNLTAELPLLAELKLDDVAFVVDAKAHGLSAKNIAEGYAVSKGTVSFTANKDRLRARGKVSLNDVPLKFDWTEQFDLSKKNTTDLSISAKLTDKQRKTFGIDLAPYVKGPVSVNLAKVGKGMNITRVGVVADMTEAIVRVPKTNLISDLKVPKKLSFTALLDGDAVTLTDIAYTSPDVEIGDGEVKLRSGIVYSASFPRLAINKLADIGVQYSTSVQAGGQLNVKGRFLDLSRIISSDEKEELSKFGLVRLDNLPKFSVRAAIRRFKVSKALVVDDFQVSLTSRPGDINLLKGEARFAGSKPLTASWKRSPDGLRKFIVETEDAGSVLRALGYYERAVDGKLVMTGNVKPSGTNNQGFEIKGRAIVKDMVIRGVSSLSNILDESSATSLSSLSEEMKNEGIKIDIVDVPFSIGDAEITIGDAFARGESVGFTFAGAINREKGQANMGGTIIPAYGLNSALGNIPLLGKLLVGRAKEGVLGITYSVSGPIDNPKVTVNPLSALTPGILRRIFDRHGGTSQQTANTTTTQSDYPDEGGTNADP